MGRATGAQDGLESGLGPHAMAAQADVSIQRMEPGSQTKTIAGDPSVRREGMRRVAGVGQGAEAADTEIHIYIICSSQLTRTGLGLAHSTT